MESNGQTLILPVFCKKKVDNVTLGVRRCDSWTYTPTILCLHRGLEFSYTFILQQFLGAQLHIKVGI